MQPPAPSPGMSEGMRRALFKVGAVAVSCMVALAAVQSASQQRRTTEARESHEVPPRVVTTEPAVLKSQRVGETERPTLRAVSFRQQETPRQTAQEAARVEEASLAALRKAEAQATALREDEARQRMAVREASRAEENRLAALRAAEARSAEDERRRSEAWRIAQEMRAPAPTVARILPLFSGPATASALPTARSDGWVRYDLRPGSILHVQTNGRPCTVRTDTTMDIFPNNPSLSHQIVEAGRGLRFPILRGQGPKSIHASPLGGESGTLEFRYDD